MLGFVMRRQRGRVPLAAAVLLTVLITTTVLTALFAFTRGVGDAGLRESLQGRDQVRSTVVVTGYHPAADRAKDDQALRGFGDALFGRLPFTTESLPRSHAYGLPGATPGSAAGSGTSSTPAGSGTSSTPAGSGPSPEREADLTLLAALDRARTKLVAGQWPQPVGSGATATRVPVAVPEAALHRLGLTASALPAEVRLDDRLQGTTLTVVVTGVYRAADPAAAYWQLDPVGGRGAQTGGFTTYGPLLVDDSAFTVGGLAQDSRLTLLTPDFAGVRTAEAEAVGARSAALEASLKTTSGLNAKTELRTVMQELHASRSVAWSTLLIGEMQLVVLTAATLLIVGGTLMKHQEPERTLLLARGASRRRLSLLTGTEALLLALPAAALAPLLAPLLLRFLGGVDSNSGAWPGHWSLWPVAAGCALGCVLLTTLPAALRGASAVVRRHGGKRQEMVAGAARSGADLALLALAALAFQQLNRYKGAGPTAGGGAPTGVDPVVIAAPTLALCAGAVLVLRVLPLAARLGGHLAARGSGLGPALVGWQLARRPQRATGPVVLLVLAVSSGVLALGQYTAWSDSQRDQASYTTAGGLRITGSQLAPVGQSGRYGALPGGERVLPVIRSEQSLPEGRTGQLLALDAASVADRVPLRADLRNEQPMGELFGPLTPGAPGAPAKGTGGIPLPGQPQRIGLDLTLRATGVPTGSPGLRLLLRDRFGLSFLTPVVALPTTDKRVTVPVDLAALADAPAGRPGGPLTLVAVSLSYGAQDPQAPPLPSVGGELTVHGLSVTGDGGGPAVPVPPAAGAVGWQLGTVPKGSEAALLGNQAAGPADGPALLRMSYSGAPPSRGEITLALTAGPVTSVQELPGIATRGYLKAIGAKVGDVVGVPFAQSMIRVRVTAAVNALPVAGDTALAVDLTSLGRIMAADGARALPGVTEWWLPGVSPDDPVPARAAAALRTGAGAGTQRVLLREEVAAGLLDDPLSTAPQRALAVLAVACAALAAIGFAASAAAGARERSRESAVLLALGAPRRTLNRTAAAEGLILAGLGCAAGVGIGTALVHLVAPLIVRTPSGRRPYPELLVDLPVGWTLLLTAAIAVVPLLSATLGGRRNRNTAARLRQVEES
ncbi:ABC transporter permease [Streptomyces sp. G-G2]|uniref:ABC transporter permease n=1 Tax=Streptomyces sp. G-G2 TaxID=3046201 RepID=UPI0024BB0C84|nr:ABC transporter permease [Streptomyces sp. G-G2]MDJ0382083.1 ABC transporter permease [Streptomyces sp. G-G2]